MKKNDYIITERDSVTPLGHHCVPGLINKEFGRGGAEGGRCGSLPALSRRRRPERRAGGAKIDNTCGNERTNFCPFALVRRTALRRIHRWQIIDCLCTVRGEEIKRGRGMSFPEATNKTAQARPPNDRNLKGKRTAWGDRTQGSVPKTCTSPPTPQVSPPTRLDTPDGAQA